MSVVEAYLTGHMEEAQTCRARGWVRAGARQRTGEGADDQRHEAAKAVCGS